MCTANTAALDSALLLLVMVCNKMIESDNILNNAI